MANWQGCDPLLCLHKPGRFGREPPPFAWNTLEKRGIFSIPRVPMDCARDVARQVFAVMFRTIRFGRVREATLGDVRD